MHLGTWLGTWPLEYDPGMSSERRLWLESPRQPFEENEVALMRRLLGDSEASPAARGSPRAPPRPVVQLRIDYLLVEAQSVGKNQWLNHPD